MPRISEFEQMTTDVFQHLLKSKKDVYLGDKINFFLLKHSCIRNILSQLPHYSSNYISILRLSMLLFYSFRAIKDCHKLFYWSQLRNDSRFTKMIDLSCCYSSFQSIHVLYVILILMQNWILHQKTKAERILLAIILNGIIILFKSKAAKLFLL